MKKNSRNVLNRHALDRFDGSGLFDRIARAACEAECLPRKELYEAWETARRVRRIMRGGPIVDLAAGHGLVAMILLLLDDTSPTALCIDTNRPPSFEKLLAVMTGHWPRLEGRIVYQDGPLQEVKLPEDALVVSVHACGLLTDQVLDLALAGGHRVAVLPCCHDLRACDTGGLENWMDGPLAVDVVRVERLKRAGYEVKLMTIPDEITPKNRLIMAWKSPPQA